MKYHLRTSLLLLLLGFTFVSKGYGTKFHLRFSGGLSYLTLNHTNKVIQDRGLYLKKYSEHQPGWQYLEGEMPGFHSGLDFEGEITVFLSSRFAVGLSTGYIYTQLSEKRSAFTIRKGKYSFHYARLTTISALPLTVCGYYFLPLSKKIDFYLKSNTGVIWGQYVNREAIKRVESEKYAYTPPQKASALSPLLSSSLGTMYEVEPGIYFFTEGSLRWAKLRGLAYKKKNEQPQTLYYFEEYFPSLQLWRAQMETRFQEPEGEHFRSVKEAEVDLSGLSFKIGFMVKF